MQVIFDKRIPDIVNEHAASELTSFLAEHKMEIPDIGQFLYHPGGMKVVEAYETAYETNGNGFALSRDILRDFGNMSSATVMFVIERYLAQRQSTGSEHCVISALGPGFCSESLLVT
jgi:alkylresorcinol/alkylpyrone synthase